MTESRTPPPRPVRPVAVALLAIVALALSGCAVSAPAAGARTPPATSPTPTSTPLPNVVLIGVIGTGAFATPDGSTVGSATITADPGGFHVSLSGFHSTEPGELQLGLSPWAIGTPCLADTHTASLGDISSLGDLRGLPIGEWNGDPSIFRTLVLSVPALNPRTGAAVDGDGCVLTPLATAPITWTVPDTRPGLHVADAGPRTGATGTVTQESGAPATYLVAAGDAVSAIADRFGISMDDVEFLNPLNDMPLRAGQRLNLSKALRGTGLLPPPSEP
ncbi:LysM peptidoglycan-binding domain-containing protein [Leifsonia poae]|uniref:LysM peptidoglycan-binding domain-containing protein n=1 Tax=Leifsonia poae TaxID=110933 RepID=UPI001CBF2B65|nr:LysM domain-containing protein [Leifsonia poae]